MAESAYRIPLFDLNVGREEEEKVLATLRSKWISMGENVRAFESEFAHHLGAEHAVAVTNCTAALHLALRILGVGEGDEVIVPSLTFVASVNAVRYVGAAPVFADVIGPHDLSLDPADVERRITSRTRAIIPVHYGGFACEMGALMRIARSRGLFVVEDAAHAPDSEYEGKKLGTIGEFGCFSFFSNKNITSAEGGLLVTNNDEHARRARLLRAHGMTTLSYDRAKGHATRYDVVELGYNYRMDDLRGALAHAQFARLESDVSIRRQLRSRYVERLSGVEEIVIPYLDSLYKSSNYIFPIVLKDSDAAERDRVRAGLKKAGVETSVHYPAVHRFSVYSDYTRELPMTEKVSDSEITLPLYATLAADDIDYVCDELTRLLA
jgi:dTDP-4-amino-4,6-dideoxygalactose transaminase